MQQRYVNHLDKSSIYYHYSYYSILIIEYTIIIIFDCDRDYDYENFSRRALRGMTVRCMQLLAIGYWRGHRPAGFFPTRRVEFVRRRWG